MAKNRKQNIALLRGRSAPMSKLGRGYMSMTLISHSSALVSRFQS